jgi:hypothetical protein
MGSKSILLFLAGAIVILIIIVFWSVSKPKMIKDETGSKIYCKRVVLVFKTKEKNLVNQAVDSINGKIINEIPESNTYEIEIPGNCNLKTVLSALDTVDDMPGVNNALKAYVGQPLVQQ